MMTVIKPITPDITPVLSGNFYTIIPWLMVLIISGLSALFMARYAAERFKTDKRKTVICFIALSVVLSVMMLCFFGFSAIAMKGIILSLIFILSSFEDIKTRECDDFLHVMIVIAAFLGINLTALPGMLISAIFVFAIMIGTILVTNGDIGGADIKMSVACAFLLGIRKGILGLIIGLILAVIFNIFKKNKKAGFPLIPYLAVGFMTAYFI